MTVRPPTARWAWLLAAAVLGIAAMLPTAARADVAYRTSDKATLLTTGTTSSSLAIPKPAGLVAGDVMIAIVRWQHGNDITSVGYSAPAGWTKIDDNEATGSSYAGTAVWWARASAGDVAAPSFTFTRSWTNSRTTIASGSVSAYSGVDTVSAFSWPSPLSSSLTVQAASTQTTIPFMRPPGTYEIGSMEVLVGSMAKIASSTAINVPSVTNGTQRKNSPIQDGGINKSISTVIADKSEDGCGGYPAQTVANLSIDAYTSAWSFVLTPANTLSVGEPSSISFGSAALTGLDLTRTASAAYTVSDTRASGAGWSLSLSPTQFTAGANTLPANALRVTGASNAAGSAGRCSAPSNSVTYPPLVLPAGTPTKLYSAAASSGRGASDLTLDLALLVPGSARTGAYASTWTVTLSSGP